MTPAEARAACADCGRPVGPRSGNHAASHRRVGGVPVEPSAFLWSLTSPWDAYRAISRMADGERAEATRILADRLGVSPRTIQRRVARYWPPEKLAPGTYGLHEVRCQGPAVCECREVIVGVIRG